jgi:type I restriction enzyme S subunit
MDNAVPVGWTTKPFKSICKRLVNGGTPDTGDPQYWDGETPWITGADFSVYGLAEFRRHVSDKALRTTATNIVGRGNLLVVTRTGVGKIAIAPCDVAISQDITGVYLDQDQVDPRYIYFQMVRGIEELKKLNQGTSINGIIRSDFEKFPILIPDDLPEQLAIARILSTTDAAIRATDKLIAKYENVKTA